MGAVKSKAKDHAKLLFLDSKQKHSIKEIADRVGVRPNTVGNWIKKENWERLRKSLMVTRKKLIMDWYDQIEWLNNDINSREKKIPTTHEANTLVQLAASIKKLETETSIAEIYEVATQFLDFLKPIDFDMYKKLLPYFDEFINSKLG